MAQIHCLLWNISGGYPENENAYLNSDGDLPPSGLDPNLEYYAYNTPYNEPDYESRGRKLLILKERKDDPHPIYSVLKTCEITFDTEKLPDSELVISVKQAHELMDKQLRASYANSDSKAIRVQKIQNKKLAQITTDAEEDELIDEIDELANKLDNNADTANEMYNFIEAHTSDNLIPDFNFGWIVE